MIEYRAAAGERLDTIIYKIYGTLDSEIIAAVIEENKHLLASSVLAADDIVYLPEIETKQDVATVKALWS